MAETYSQILNRGRSIVIATYSREPAGVLLRSVREELEADNEYAWPTSMENEEKVYFNLML
jgi:hypothetical protein